MCPLFALVMALILLVIEFMRALICLMGMLFYSSTRALVNWARVAGVAGAVEPVYPTGPIDAQSGTNRGYMAANQVVERCCLPGKTWQILAVWGLALSCCRVRLCCCKKGITWGRRISSLYLAAVKLPSITTNCDFIPCEIPPHTITDPPPNLFSLQRKDRQNVPTNSITKRIRAMTRANSGHTNY